MASFGRRVSSHSLTTLHMKTVAVVLACGMRADACVCVDASISVSYYCCSNASNLFAARALLVLSHVACLCHSPCLASLVLCLLPLAIAPDTVVVLIRMSLAQT